MIYIKTDKCITAFIDNHVYNVLINNPQWADACTAIMANDETAFIVIANYKSAVAKTLAHTGFTTNLEGLVCYNGTPLHSALNTRLKQMLGEQSNVEPIKQFINNLLKNPSANSIEQLYTFLERCNLPITEDGCFIAYKRVNNQWRDFYTDSINNSIGTTVKVPRNSVDDDFTQECSYGLHVCSLAYLDSYHAGDGHLIIVKINPEHVVSVPKTYDFSKMRVCEYEVLCEIPESTVQEIDAKWKALVYTESFQSAVTALYNPPPTTTPSDEPFESEKDNEPSLE